MIKKIHTILLRFYLSGHYTYITHHTSPVWQHRVHIKELLVQGRVVGRIAHDGRRPAEVGGAGGALKVGEDEVTEWDHDSITSVNGHLRGPLSVPATPDTRAQYLQTLSKISSFLIANSGLNFVIVDKCQHYFASKQKQNINICHLFVMKR